ncbi:MAG: hypothetical protein PHY99_04985 [Bacteroidales bacterium]|nr:hypothetical protein [Bacteroidales bacterium]
MKALRYLILILLVFIIVRCDGVTGGGDNPPEPVTTGILEVDFQLPTVQLPTKNIHRVDLSIARTTDSLNKGLFISSANVLDSKTIYRFTLVPGTYYYRAGVTCSCLGDSCLWGGFPGGRYGVRWASGKVIIALGQVTRDVPSFQ